MKLTIKTAAVILSGVLATAGGLIFSNHPHRGLFLIFLGIVGTAYTYLSSERASKRDQAKNEDLFTATAELMCGSGLGNPYTKRILKRIHEPGDFLNIFAELDKALSVDPNDADALSLYCSCAVLHLSFRHLVSSSDDSTVSKECDRLDRLIERGISTGKRLPDFYAAKGILLDVRGMHREARQCFDMAGESRDDPYLRLMTATSYGMEGDHVSALREMELIIDKDKENDSIVRFYYGRCLLYLGEYEEALANFSQVWRARKSFYELLAAMAEAHYFAWHPVRSAFWSFLAALHLVRRDRRKAVEKLGTAMRHVCVQPIIFVGKLIDAITRQISRITGVNVKRLSHPDEPYFSLGNSLVKMKRYQAAQKMYAKASKTSRSVETWLSLCAASIKCKDWNAAERANNHVLKRWPENEIARFYVELISRRGEV